MTAVEDLIARVQEHGHKVIRYEHGLILVNAYKQEDADWLHALGFSALPYQPERGTNPDRLAWECTIHASKLEEAVA